MSLAKFDFLNITTLYRYYMVLRVFVVEFGLGLKKQKKYDQDNTYVGGLIPLNLVISSIA